MDNCACPTGWSYRVGSPASRNMRTPVLSVIPLTIGAFSYGRSPSSTARWTTPLMLYASRGMAPSVNAFADEKNPGAPRESCCLLSCSTPDLPLLGGSPTPFSRSLAKSSVVEDAVVFEGASDADGAAVEGADVDGADVADRMGVAAVADVGPATAVGTTTARPSVRTNAAMRLINSPPSGLVSVVVGRVPARDVWREVAKNAAPRLSGRQSVRPHGQSGRLPRKGGPTSRADEPEQPAQAADRCLVSRIDHHRRIGQLHEAPAVVLEVLATGHVVLPLLAIRAVMVAVELGHDPLLTPHEVRVGEPLARVPVGDDHVELRLGQAASQEEKPRPGLHRRVVARPQLGQRLGHERPASTASSPADRLGKLGGRDATLVVNNRVPQHDQLVPVEGTSCREIAPGVLRADDAQAVALHDASGLEPSMSRAAGPSNLGSCGDVHDVKRLGRRPATGDRQPKNCLLY